MKNRSWSCLLLVALAASAPAFAGDSATAADRTFVGLVSQGGAYEVQASKLAEQKAHAQDVIDLATMEVHDHQLVGADLKRVSAARGVPIAPALNAMFQGKLNHLRGLSGAAFDAAYLSDMKAIHDKDEKLFAQEAKAGGADQYRAFAAKTDPIVKRHIGALHGLDK